MKKRSLILKLVAVSAFLGNFAYAAPKSQATKKMTKTQVSEGYDSTNMDDSDESANEEIKPVGKKAPDQYNKSTRYSKKQIKKTKSRM